MENKNNKGIIILLLVIIVILAVLCILFATDTISLKSNITIKENENKKKDEETTLENKEKTKTSEISNQEIYDLFDKITGNWIKCTITDSGCVGFFYNITNESISTLKFQSDRGITQYILSVEKVEDKIYKINTVSPASICYGCVHDSTKASYDYIYLDVSKIDNNILKEVRYLENGEIQKGEFEYAGKDMEEINKFFERKGIPGNHDYLKYWIK